MMARIIGTIAICFGVAACTQAAQVDEGSSESAVRMSLASQSTPSAIPPEPPGGCKAVVEKQGACGKEGGGQAVCAASADMCRQGEIFFVPKDSRCEFNRTCTFEPIKRVREGNALVNIFEMPAKGGKSKDVRSADPICHPTSLKAARCHWDCIVAPPGEEIDPASVSFTAKEANGQHAWSADPLGSGWGDCKAGQDCDIGWAKWVEPKVTSEYACGRFKQWRHERARYAKIQVRLK